jgi:hypothetical protein
MGSTNHLETGGRPSAKQKKASSSKGMVVPMLCDSASVHQCIEGSAGQLITYHEEMFHDLSNG